MQKSNKISLARNTVAWRMEDLSTKYEARHLRLIQFLIQFRVMRAVMPQTQLSMPPAAPSSRALQEHRKIQTATNEVPCRRNVQFVRLRMKYTCEQTFGLITLNKSRLRSEITDSHLYAGLESPQPDYLMWQQFFSSRNNITILTRTGNQK